MKIAALTIVGVTVASYALGRAIETHQRLPSPAPSASTHHPWTTSH
ncbi:MAG: hypothetical protein ACHREM_04115 [Polyangiales bacterium]